MNMKMLSRFSMVALLVMFGFGCKSSYSLQADLAPAKPTPAQVSAKKEIAANPAATGETRDIDIAATVFNPAGVAVKSGTTVTWTNKDPMSHTVTADDKSFASGEIKPGESFSHTFTTVGTVFYHCEMHPEMKASVTTE